MGSKKDLNDGEVLEVRVEEVQYEANVWNNVHKAMEEIVSLARGLRLNRETFDPHFFGEAVKGQAEVTKKVLGRCGEGEIVTKKFRDLLTGFAEYYSSLAIKDHRPVPSPRPVPAPAPQQPPAEWQENFRARLGLWSGSSLDSLLKTIHDNVTDLVAKITEMSKAADEQIAKLESFFWQFMPWTAAQIRAIRIGVQAITEFAKGFLRLVDWIVQQARLPKAMYDDALKWVEMRNKANEINTWLSTNVLNPERGLPTNLREQLWHGVAEQAYAAQIPSQQAAANSIGLITNTTAGSLMGCFGAQVYVLSVLSSVIIDVIKLVVDITKKILTRSVPTEAPTDWFSFAIDTATAQLKNAKEGDIATLQAEATSKYNDVVMRMQVADNSAFAYRADLQLVTAVSQLPTSWPDPTTRANTPWPRDRGKFKWEVSRDPLPRPAPTRKR
jgi:hypothetical protein